MSDQGTTGDVVDPVLARYGSDQDSFVRQLLGLSNDAPASNVDVEESVVVESETVTLEPALAYVPYATTASSICSYISSFCASRKSCH